MPCWYAKMPSLCISSALPLCLNACMPCSRFTYVHMCVVRAFMYVLTCLMCAKCMFLSCILSIPCLSVCVPCHCGYVPCVCLAYVLVFVVVSRAAIVKVESPALTYTKTLLYRKATSDLSRRWNYSTHVIPSCVQWASITSA